MKKVFVNNPDFTDWTDDLPNGWDKGNINWVNFPNWGIRYFFKEDINPEKLQDIYNISVRRIYYFKIFGKRFWIKGRDLLKNENFKKVKL
jgi:hypothetical protein